MLLNTISSVYRRQQLGNVYNALKSLPRLQIQFVKFTNFHVINCKTNNKMTTTIEQQRAILPKFNSSCTNKSNTHLDEDQVNINNSQSIESQYEETVNALNTLQSNADTIRRSIALNNKQMPLNDMYKYLERSGLSLDEIETKLSFIHVSGSKGKGTTCALTESILRAYGLKTGFFSSPHLVSVTERIRINGLPIEKAQFVQIFWRVYRRLQQSKQLPNDMPPYFKFLTILCLHIFLEQQVDVVLLEVGIGGEFDCTNIIRNTKTVGITSLGLEHTQLLGNTLGEIAWQKAGIIKPYADVYTTVTQSECLEVLRQRAADKKANVHIVPEFSSYFHDAKSKTLLTSLNNVMQLNGSLAIQLAHDWLRKERPALLAGSTTATDSDGALNEQVLQGLTQCEWAGRCQLLQLKNLNIYLDGAHTLESICVCSNWFQRVTSDNSVVKVLIFNTTGDRDSRKLLDILRSESNFDLACFVPNISSGCSNRGDIQSVYGISEQIKRAKLHAGYWHLLCTEADESDTSQVFGSILDAFKCIDKRYTSQQQIDVLVTGSLHLIGATLAALEELKQRH